MQRIKHLYRAAKAGHTGSLDPLATGLLPICLGEATKLSGYLLDANKSYRARAAVGTRTTTADAEGEVVERSDASRLTRQELEQALPRFTGEILQRPPMYSALKYQGERLYKLARAGREVDRPERRVLIHELRLTGFGPGFFELDLRCSKGTYVRTLIEDLAAAVGQCAHVAALRRLESGPFREPEMRTLEDLEALAKQGPAALDAVLLPPLAGLAGWPQLKVDSGRAFYLSRGQPVRAAAAPASGPVAVTDESGRLLGIAEMNADGLLAPKRWLAQPS